MAQDFFRGTTPEMRWGMVGFCIAAIGAILGFLGFGIAVRTVSLVGFGLCVVGVAIGFIAVAIGMAKWLRRPRHNLAGSIEASKQLHERLMRTKKRKA